MVHVDYHPIKTHFVERQYDAIRNTMLLSNLTNQSSRLEKVLALAFSRQTAWRRAYKPRASYKAVFTGTRHEQHLLQFTDPGVQHSLLLFCLGSPPLLHLLDLSLVLNLVRWHLIIMKTEKKKLTYFNDWRSGIYLESHFNTICPLWQSKGVNVIIWTLRPRLH